MLEEVNLLKYSNKPRVVRLIFFLGAATVLAQTPLERSSAMQALDQWSSVCEKDGLVLWGRTYRDELCSGTEKMEAAMEKQEGLAEYTGVFIALRETGESISREARIVEAFEDSNAYARSFAYATRPALGLLLDRYGPGWRTGVAKAESLDSMLIAALKFQPPEMRNVLRGSILELTRCRP
jgi:hypothetical protein